MAVLQSKKRCPGPTSLWPYPFTNSYLSLSSPDLLDEPSQVLTNPLVFRPEGETSQESKEEPFPQSGQEEEGEVGKDFNGTDEADSDAMRNGAPSPELPPPLESDFDEPVSSPPRSPPPVSTPPRKSYATTAFPSRSSRASHQKEGPSDNVYREQGWNSRHSVSPSRWNEKNHDFFVSALSLSSAETVSVTHRHLLLRSLSVLQREYFDRYPRRTTPAVLKPESPGRRVSTAPSSSIYQTYEIGTGRMEEPFDPRHHISVSKDNRVLYPGFRDYFDSPRLVDEQTKPRTFRESDFFPPGGKFSDRPGRTRTFIPLTTSIPLTSRSVSPRATRRSTASKTTTASNGSQMTQDSVQIGVDQANTARPPSRRGSRPSKSSRGPRQGRSKSPRAGRPSPALRKREVAWDNRHHLVASKANPISHPHFREYFDRPRYLFPDGTSRKQSSVLALNSLR